MKGEGIHTSYFKIHNCFIGGVAQLGEHLPCTQGVIGSIPFTSTKKLVSVSVVSVSEKLM